MYNKNDKLIKFFLKRDRLFKYFENSCNIVIIELLQKAKNNDTNAILDLESIRVNKLLSSLRKKQMNFF